MAVYGGKAAGSFGALGGELRFEWVPDPEVIAAALFEAAAAIENMEPPLMLSRQIAIEDIRHRFATHTAPDGSPWVAWSESYAPDALRNNIGGILQRTGELETAATAESAFLVDGNSVFYDTGNLPPHWIWNQEGAERGGGGGKDVNAGAATSIEDLAKQTAQGDTGGAGNTLPARPFVGTSFEAELQMVEIFDQWFEGAIALGISSKGKAFPRHNVRGPGGRFASRG